MMTRIAAALLFGVLALAPAAFAQEVGGRSLEQMVEQAKTPQDHEALAKYYEQQAEEARAEVKRHEKMAKAYGAGNLSMRDRMKRHCQALAKDAQASANEYDDLAKLHEEMAKKAM